MPPTALRRRPPLNILLAASLPVPAMIVAAAYLPSPLAALCLLLANSLMFNAAGLMAGARPANASTRHVSGRMLAHLIFFTIYTAGVLALVAWPMAQLAQRPTLGGVLVLSTVLAGCIAALWRHWPVFALVFTRSAAGHGKPASLRPVLSQSLRLARQLSAEQRLFADILPVAGGMLACAMGVLALGGLVDGVPEPLRMRILWLYGLVLLPLSAALAFQRTLRVLARSGVAPAAAGEDLAPRDAVLPDQAGTDADVSDPDTFTGEGNLIDRVRAGHVEQALALLEQGADPNEGPQAGDRDQRSALILAAQLPETRLLRAMISHGADVNRVQGGLTPLLAATRDSYHGRAEAVMTLLANGADPSFADADGNTPLHGAALSVEPSVAAMLIDAGANPNVLNRTGLTPLATACRAGNWALVQYLLEHGARAALDHGEPALLSAASIAEDDPEGVQLLLRHKAPVNGANAIGRNALMAAALEGHADIARALVGAGIDIDAVDGHGTTALMEASRSGALGVVHVLAAAGADVHCRDKHGRDALMLACQSPRTQGDIVRSLLDLGADPRAVGNDGRSALDHAASTGRWDLVALMDPETPLPANLDVGAGPEPGADTPDHLADALRFGHWAIASTFSRRVREWPREELGQVFLVLADAAPAARRWLLDHGLSPHARLADGTPLLDALIDALPDSAAAIHELLDAGAEAAGGARIARALVAASADPGCADVVLRMLQSGGDPFARHAGSATPVHLAASFGQTAVLDALLAIGCNPNVTDATGRTPLHAALEHADPLPQIRALIRAGADPEAAAANNETPLGAVLDHADPDVPRWLRWGDAWPLPGRALRTSDLPAAAATGDNEAVCKLLALGFPVDSRDAQGASALLRAAGMGHTDTAHLLIEHEADLALSARTGVTPLAAAANAGRADMVELLLDNGAQIDQPLPGRTTAMMLAVARGHVDIVERMLAAGADIHVRDMYARSVLHPAAQFCFAGRDSLRARRMLDLLLRHGAEVNFADQDERTPLLLLLGAHAPPGAACDGTHLGALLPVLLDAGADPRQSDRRGITPLHACAMHMLVGPARLLLANGAARDAVDEQGRTPAELARELGYIDVAVELEARTPGVPGVSQTLRRPAAD